MPSIYLLCVDYLQQPEYFQKAIRCLPDSERIRLQRIQNLQQQRRALGAKQLLCFVLKQYGIYPAVIETGEHGKPFLPQYPEFHFNLSHSGAYVVCVCAANAVGVDLEQCRKRLPKPSKRIFSQTELNFLNQASSDDYQNRFLTLWTMKESYVKMIGGRIFQQPYLLSMIHNDTYRKVWKERQCFFRRYRFGEYYLAVCSRENRFSDVYFFVTENDIFS